MLLATDQPQGPVVTLVVGLVVLGLAFVNYRYIDRVVTALVHEDRRERSLRMNKVWGSALLLLCGAVATVSGLARLV